LRELDYKWLRENVAIVSQEAELFSDTIRANIAYGALGENVTNEDINEACRRANAWEFIDKLENGLDTNIGEGMF
jgi:ATP-binding cassette, subfamily B, bacterial MsbA